MIQRFIIPCLFFLSGLAGIGFAESPEEFSKASDCLTRKGEVYFTFNAVRRDQLDSLTRIISIDRITRTGDAITVFAYANKKGFSRFRNFSIDYTVLPLPGEMIRDPKMYNLNKGDTKAWDAYPTYESYVALMNAFATNYPDLCRIVDAGATVRGRHILFAVISDNVNSNEAEPHVMLTSSMHGDETAGYITMLHLIDSLLTGYATSTNIRNLVNATTIWINPLANPDGTYAGGNATVAGATRFNANNIDINRNFPNPVGGDHPDGEAWQPETDIMRTLASAQQFTLSVNFHGGAELLNYLWDSWTSTVNASPDDAYWQHVCRAYADLVHANSPAGYLDDENNGITNGGDWYIVYGSRQDYMAYYRRCREVTIEMSATKLIPPAELLNFWNYHYRSLFYYISQANFGINGTVTDQSTSRPVMATISVLNHDRNNSEVRSTAQLGDYYRPIQAGSFSLDVRASGYVPKVVPVSAAYEATTRLNVALTPLKTTNRIKLSGTLLTSAGTPAGSGTPVTYDVTVRLYAQQNGNQLRYTENFLTSAGQGITIADGDFSVVLGTGSSTDNLQSVVSSNNNLWVEIAVDGDLLNRIPLTASPFTLTR